MTVKTLPYVNKSGEKHGRRYRARHGLCPLCANMHGRHVPLRKVRGREWLVCDRCVSQFTMDVSGKRLAPDRGGVAVRGTLWITPEPVDPATAKLYKAERTEAE